MRSEWIALQRCLMAALLFLVGAQCGISQTAPAVGQEAPFRVHMADGDLSVEKQGDFPAPVFQVVWQGKTLLQEDKATAVTVAAVTGANTRVLVLSFSMQGEDCPALYRILDLGVKPQPYLSKALGDCSDVPHILRGEDVVRLSFPGFHGRQASTWTYTVANTAQAGTLQVTRGGK